MRMSILSVVLFGKISGSSLPFESKRVIDTLRDVFVFAVDCDEDDCEEPRDASGVICDYDTQEEIDIDR